MRAILIVWSVVQLSAADTAAVHVRNFQEVNNHLYRGGEPSPAGIDELGAFGIKLIVDLREVGSAPNAEKQKAGLLGIRYLNVPLPRLSAPTQADMERVLALLVQNGANPIFVHCWRGKDRTGTVIACYRIQHDGWDNRQALDEAKRFGLSGLEPSMRAFISRFRPLTLPVLPNLGN